VQCANASCEGQAPLSNFSTAKQVERRAHAGPHRETLAVPLYNKAENFCSKFMTMTQSVFLTEFTVIPCTILHRNQ
jgi:hypothetical protein